MDFKIAPETENLRAKLEKFIADEVLPLEKQYNVNLNTVFPQEAVDKIRKRSVKLGFYGIEMPERFSGKEIGLLTLCILEEEIGRSGCALGGFILGDLGGPSRGSVLFDSCTEAQVKKYVMPIMKAEKTCCFAFTEPGGGSAASSIQTSAVKQGDSYIINGTKTYVTYGPYADVIILVAITDKELGAHGGATTFFVDKTTPGFKVAEVQNTATLQGTNMEATLTFKNCAVPVENVIGEVGKGFTTSMIRINHSRIRWASSCVGVAERLLKLSTDYAKERVQSGKPIAERDVIQAMLADTATEIYAARCMVYDASWKVDQGMEARKEAAMVKLFASEMVNRVADRAVQIHGGAGLMIGHPVEIVYHRIRAARIATGTSEMQRATIAKALLKD